MLGRSFVCAIVMMGVATPAAAGERSSYSPNPDTLRLLLLDAQATFTTQAPLTALAPFEARAPLAATAPFASTLAGFETLAVPASVDLPGMEGRGGQSRYILEAPQPGFSDWPLPSIAKRTGTFGADDAIASAMANGARPPRMRGRSSLDTMLTIRLDGEESTRSVSMRGPASVLNLIPVR
jgi:hypothetical protein